MTTDTSATTTVDYYSWMAEAAEKWAKHAQGIADKLAQGTYTTGDVAKDIGHCNALAVDYAAGYMKMVSACLAKCAPSSNPPPPPPPSEAPVK